MKTPKTYVSTKFSQPETRQPRGFWLGAALLLLTTFLMPLSLRADITWGLTNSGASTGNWSAGGSWVGGVVPMATDNAVFSRTNIDVPTVTVDVSTNIQNLTFNSVSNTVADTVGSTFAFASGTKLSVLGPNGLTAQHLVTGVGLGFKAKRLYTFTGNGTLLVSNIAGNFVLNSGQGYGQSSSSSGVDTYSLAGLTNLIFYGNVFGAADFNLAGGAAVGDQGVTVLLAQTNIITAWQTNDFTQPDFTNSVEIGRLGSNPSTSMPQNSQYQLGIYNVFNCDSFGLGRGNFAGNTSTMSMSAIIAGNGKNSVGYQVAFNTVNAAAPVSTAIFRNTNGVSRMSYLMIGVDSGTLAVTNNRNNGILNLAGGNVNMLVDKIWLGSNRTNSANTAGGNGSDCGGFAFTFGTVDANIVEAGYMQYSNNANCIGVMLVGTNATLKINNRLDLGLSPVSDPTELFNQAENLTYGQVYITNGATALINKVNVGAFSTNNQITVTPGGKLVVSNTIASSAGGLTTLTLGGTGTQLSFFSATGTTNAFVTNLVCAASPATINILGYTGPVPGTNVLIKYTTFSGSVPQIGTIPPGYNNMQIQNDGTEIVLIASANAPKNLKWVGNVNNHWDHSTFNWLDTNANTSAKFTDNDKVIFDDSSSQPDVTIVEAVNPASILVTNNSVQYVFDNGGGNTIGGATLTKAGNQSLEIDTAGTALSVSLNNGSLIGSGGVSSVTVAPGTTMNFGGTIASTLSDSGNATLASGGTINGPVTVNTGATFGNAGTLNSSLSMSSGASATNYSTGLLTTAGLFHVTTNSVLVNAGTIYANILTVDLGGTLIDTTSGSANYGAGSMNFYNPANNAGELDVLGTFIPGGNSIQTTKITDYEYSGSTSQGHNGRVQLESGSTTIIKVDMDNPLVQTNTKILSLNQSFGGSFNFKSFTGGTLVITNLGSTHFAAGQSFKVFGYYGDDTDFFDGGFNTTNTYPIIQPSVPGPGLVWELDQLYDHGYIRILSANDPSRKFSLTNSAYTFSNGTNTFLVSQLAWPTNQQGFGFLQQLQTTLTNGLAATNWTSVSGNYESTNVGIQIMSNTNVWLITNTLVGDPTAIGSAAFYRFVYP